MKIDSLFNETELTIFFRQTGFTFSDCYRTSDGTIFAVDRQSNQVFVGNDLFRNNVHPLDSLESVDVENGQIHLSFKNSSSAVVIADGGEAGSVLDVLRDFVKVDQASTASNDGHSGDLLEGYPVGRPLDELKQSLDSEEQVLDEMKQPVDREGWFLGEMEQLQGEEDRFGDEMEQTSDEMEQEEDNSETEKEDESDYNLVYGPEGIMSRGAILRVIKKLKPGDRIHLEYKPVLGKLRVYDTEYVRLEIDLNSSRYFTLFASGADYVSLMDRAVVELFDHIDLYFFCPENKTDISCHLRRIRKLEIIQ